MSVALKSGNSTALAQVTADNALWVAGSQDPANAMATLAYDAAGTPILATEDGSTRVSFDALQLYEQVDGSSLNTNLWTTSVSTMTVSQASGFIVLNAGGSTAANGYAILQSIRSFALYGTQPFSALFNMKITTQPQANCVMEVGIGIATGTSAPSDGAFFRWNASSELRAVISYGGAEVQSAALTPPANGDMVLYRITVVDDLVQFWMDDILVASVAVQAGQAYPVSAGRQPLLARVYNTSGIPSAAPEMMIGQIVAVQQALQQNKDFGQVLAQMGRGAYQSPTAYTQTTNHTNSTSPVSATLSNTAAGYTTLGGRYQFVALAGAATDYALFAYQVPAGYQLVVKEVAVSSVSTGAAGSLTVPTVLDWGLGLNASAVSLATADGAGTWAPRRLPIGTQSFATTTLLGGQVPDIRRTFETPLVVDGGRFFHVILQVPVGAATGSQVIRGDVMVNGYFE